MTIKTNPDLETYKDNPELRVPVQHELRFIKRDDSAILQQYQWCQAKVAFGWYDIPLEEE